MLDDDRRRQNHGPELEVRPWYRSKVARIVLVLCGVLLVFVGVAQVFEAVGFDDFDVFDGKTGFPTGSVGAPRSQSSSGQQAGDVAFDGNGADGGHMNPIVKAVGSNIKLPACAFTRAGYHFTHWTTNTLTGTGPGRTAYLPGDIYDVTTPVTFFANWTKATPVVQVSVTKMGEVVEGGFDTFDESTDYCVLLVTNDSDETLTLDAIFTYSSQSGRELGKSYDDATALAPGDFAILIGFDVYDADAATYRLEASKPFEGMGSLHGMVEGREAAVTVDKATIELENTSKQEITIFCVRCVMANEQGDLFVGDSYTFATLAPGKTLQAVFTPQSMLDYNYDYPVIPAFDKMERAYFVNGAF